jgi:hypothetical protein
METPKVVPRDEARDIEWSRLDEDAVELRSADFDEK